MARFSAGLRTASAGSTTLPSAALAGSASNGFILREVAVFNTTITACVYKLVRLSTAGTPGAGATEAEWDEDGPAPACTLAGVYTSTAPTTTELGILFPLGAAIGSGVVRTFGGPGIRCLLAGEIRVEVNGAAHSLRPGEAWFEAGPDPVLARASEREPTSFARVMILPRELQGKPSIRYVRPEDHDKPKTQSYQVFCDEFITP